MSGPVDITLTLIFLQSRRTTTASLYPILTLFDCRSVSMGRTFVCVVMAIITLQEQQTTEIEKRKKVFFFLAMEIP